ncbi:YaaA family protein [Leucobacter sp. HY1908]
MPPSETKREGGSHRFDQSNLFAHDALSEARAQVRAALEALCAPDADQEAAAKALKLGVKNRGELGHNLVLTTSGAMPVLDRYTGVLFDALDASSLDAAARSWAAGHVRVQSALFGQVRALDLIPAYRVSASSRLPALGGPLKRVWSAAHAAVPSSAFTLDLRSKDYAALAPLRAGEGFSLHVVQRGADGQVRALNHFNKAAKGDLVRRLATTGRHIDSLNSLLDWAAEQSLELTLVDDALTLVTTLGAPAHAGA